MIHKTSILFVAVVLTCDCQGMEKPMHPTAHKAPEVEPAPGVVEVLPASMPGPTSPERDGEGESDRAATSPVPVIKKIIRNADLRFRTDDYRRCRSAIGSLVTQLDGYIASEEEVNTGYSLQNTMVLRVPARNFDALVEGLAGQAAYMEKKKITARDVSEQFVDLEVRLKTKREVERGYLRILEGAKSVEDILAVEKELRVIREEIEAAEGRLKFLSNRVAFSTVSLTFHQELELQTDPEKDFWYDIVTALSTGLHWLGAFLLGILYLWPFWLLAILLVLVVRRLRRKKKRA